MEKRHAKGPSLAIGTVLGSLGGGGIAGLSPAALLSASGALSGALATGSFEVFPFFGIFDNIGLWGNTVLGSVANSVLGSFGTSSGSLGGSLGSLLYWPVSISISPFDSMANSGLNSFNSLGLGPLINSIINLL